MENDLKAGYFMSHAHEKDSFDYWAGRVIDLLAGIGLLSTFVALCILSGYFWEKIK